MNTETKKNGRTSDNLNSLVGFWERVYCDANCFKWLLPYFLKPHDWEKMASCDQYKNKLHRLVFKLSCLMTTKRGRSRAWWIYKLGRTEEQWAEWWDEYKSNDKGEFRASNPVQCADSETEN